MSARCTLYTVQSTPKRYRVLDYSVLVGRLTLWMLSDIEGLALVLPDLSNLLGKPRAKVSREKGNESQKREARAMAPFLT